MSIRFLQYQIIVSLITALLIYVFPAQGQSEATQPEKQIEDNKEPYQGVRFEEGLPWKKVWKKAKKEGKPIFLDAYTSWCKPCKMLEKATFPDQKLGEVFNTHFVSYSMDMESEEGMKVASKWKISSYPTLLFIYPDGRELYRVVGFRTPDELMEIAQWVIEGKPSLQELEAKFKDGVRDKEVLHALIRLSHDANASYENVLSDYFSSLSMTEQETEDCWELIKKYVSKPEGAGFEFLEKNIQRFSEVIGSEKIESKQLSLYRSSLTFIAFVGNKEDLEKHQGVCQRLLQTQLEKRYWMVAYFNMVYYAKIENWEFFQESMEKWGKYLNKNEQKYAESLLNGKK